MTTYKYFHRFSSTIVSFVLHSFRELYVFLLSRGIISLHHLLDAPAWPRSQISAQPLPDVLPADLASHCRLDPLPPKRLLNSLKNLNV